MPITVDTDPERDLTIFKATGLIEFEEVLFALKAFYDDEPTPNMLIDLAELPTIQISSKEIQELAVFQPRFEGNRAPGKTAILATDDLHFGMARMFEAQSKIHGATHAVMTFKDLGSAISWLDES
jgi:hypothetical protein